MGVGCMSLLDHCFPSTLKIGAASGKKQSICKIDRLFTRWLRLALIAPRQPASGAFNPFFLACACIFDTV